MLNALIEADRVELLAGETRPYPQLTDSGRPHLIHRCPKCGTAMWSNYRGRENIRFVRIGTLDEPSALSPDVHIFVRSKQPWVQLPSDVPAFETYYDTKSLWSAESLSRAAVLRR